MLHGNMSYHSHNNVHYTNVSGAPRFSQPQNGLKPIATIRDTNQQHNQNKLPHGLTVQELKEMTKARLAAEAAIEKNGRSMKPVKINGQGTTTYQRKKDQSEKRHQSRKSLQNSAASWHDDPQIEPNYSRQRSESQHEQSTLKNVQHHAIVSPRQQIDPQIFSPVKEAHFTYPGNLHRLPYGQIQDKGIDSIDSGSVTSFNSTIASEYLGSETASTSILGPSIHQSSSDDLLFPRSWSYPSGNNVIHDETHKSLSGYDFPEKTIHVGSARRRLGSSPPGFHLEVAHEDRPFSVTEELQSVNVVGSQITSGARTFDERSLKSVDSSISLSSKLQGVKSHYHNEDFNEIYNQGSSSCGSMSNSFFEKNKEGPHDFKTLSSINGDLPNLVAESVLGSSALQNDRRVVGRTNRNKDNDVRSRGKGVNDVFRVPSHNQKLSANSELMPVLTQQSANGDVLLLGRDNCGSGSWGGSNSAMSGQSITEIWSQEFNNILALENNLADKCLIRDIDSADRRNVVDSKSSMNSETIDHMISHPRGLGANGVGIALLGNTDYEHSSLGSNHDWNSTLNGNRYDNRRKN